MTTTTGKSKKEEPRFCENCGNKLVQSKSNRGIDGNTGKMTFNYERKCENTKRFLFFGSCHDHFWTHDGISIWINHNASFDST